MATRTSYPVIYVSDQPETVNSTTHGTQAIIGEDTYDMALYDAFTAVCTVHPTPTGTSPTLDIAIQTGNDGTNWGALTSIAQFTTAAATNYIQVPVDASVGSAPKTFGKYIRFMATVGGTSTPTYSITLSFHPKG